ncbi:MAG: NAD(P)-dependent oxidoreductase [Firmicutes bacterium]|nr:NAD(P)-dependent oxidoreductase [Bacillota bacterium]
MLKTVVDLEHKLSEPTPELVEDLKGLDGDILILGVSGKMGPTLAQMAVRAAELAGKGQKVYGAARFSNPDERARLDEMGVETIAIDLLNDDLSTLPEAPNVIYMVGHKFGTTGREHMAWAINTFTAGRVAETLRDRRFVVFSTGNVYPLTPVFQGGATEEHKPDPVGEYAQSCLGRERLFQYAAEKFNTPVLIYRLNYAIDLRYGVLCDIAQRVYAGESVDLNMGHVNVIWQGDANERALRALKYVSNPPKILNITGPETLSVRWLAEEFGKRFGREVHFTGTEQETALLSNAQESMRLFGYPKVTIHQMLDWTAEWIANGLPLLNKPTHFTERKGAF